MRMVRKLGTTTLLTAAVFVAAASFAWADMGSGSGQTPLSAALGFTVHDDGSGNLNYVGDSQGPNTGFHGTCNSFATTNFKVSHQGFPILKVTSSDCTDQDGVQLYLWAQFTDKGEPGTKDRLCIQWSYTPISGVNDPTVYIKDNGVIQNGNIQIHDNPDEPGHLSGIMLGVE
jgi:hypothetical protein